ncbi:unnamed protein product [Didymodactylos carnosus]|uniref:G-protein coupled receptors family 1 profile domain-containing protein n=1 Tax=Didymodactylos carnosus TaxID=1234261 RepID=A0A814QR66_9BILA|nr:unnamed protein product [Didymodactylos carnosus]CAF1123113.1 unnamed protein product [Didymodactylos carnosus]CAF3707732.1 unnamed protein product [Didymodactylos carnosus]CAF3886609.1 unnamed protein product [Didymodactylos carnosus]
MSTQSIMQHSSNITAAILKDRSAYVDSLLRKHIVNHDIGLPVVLLYSISIPVGLLANVATLTVILLFRHMQTPTNLFIFNLSCCDLFVVIFVMPFDLMNSIDRHWNMGLFMCKLIPYIKAITVTASIYTLFAISIERIYAVKRPLHARSVLTKSNAIKSNLFIWLFSMLLMAAVPFVRTYSNPFSSTAFSSNITRSIFSTTGMGINICFEQWSSSLFKLVYTIIIFIFIYVIPSLTILAAHSWIGFYINVGQSFRRSYYRSEGVQITSTTGRKIYGRPLTSASTTIGSTLFNQKNYSTVPLRFVTPNSELIRTKQHRKLLRMLIIMILLFSLSWLPYHILSLIMECQSLSEKTIITKNYYHVLLYDYALWLGEFGSVLNPICYGIMSERYQACLISLFKHT